jgi:predicted phosphodiesterase
MVKYLTKKILLVLLFCVFCLGSCNLDFLGFFVSSDLDERLKERDNLKFLEERGWTNLTLEEEYSFIVLADTHIEGGNAFGLENLVNVIKGNPAIKFVVILGDITQYGAAQDIQKFIDIADSFGIPCYPVIGNHDVYFGNWKEWRNRIGSSSYQIKGNGTTLFMLDSANSFFGKDQLDWLEREIKKLNANERVFVFTHSPLFVEGPVSMQQITDIRERARIVSILRDRCDIMFMGHSHKRVINKTGNVQYISIEDFVGKKVYCLVSVSPSGIVYSFEKLSN